MPVYDPFLLPFSFLRLVLFMFKGVKSQFSAPLYNYNCDYALPTWIPTYILFLFDTALFVGLSSFYLLATYLPTTAYVDGVVMLLVYDFTVFCDLALW